MKTTATQLKHANDRLCWAMGTTKSLSRQERADAAKVAREMAHVTLAATDLRTLLSVGVRRSSRIMVAVERSYDLLNDSDELDVSI